MTSAIRDRTHKPKPRGSYQTIDPRPIPALLKHITPRGTIWEPAAGTGEMVRRLEYAGYSVQASGLIDGAGSILTASSNFFNFKEPPHGCRTIITNPPNDLNIEFALHALKLMKRARGIIALYQRHEWDTTQESAKVFDHPAYAMKIVCRFRPVWIKPKEGEKKSSPFHRWSWFVWDWMHFGGPIIRFSP